MQRSGGRAAVAAAALLLALAGVGLTGCSSEGEPTVATGEGTGTVATDEGSVTVEQDEQVEIPSGTGSAIVNGESDGELPAGWPAEVPVPSGGAVRSGLAMTGSQEEGWTASLVYPASDSAQVAAEVTSLLTGQGFESVSDFSTADGAIGVYQGSGFAVTATVGQEGEAATLVMTVAVTS